MRFRPIALLLATAVLQACIPSGKADAVCDGELQSDEQNYPTTGAGSVDAPWDLDGDGTFDASNADCVAAYPADKLDCDDNDASVGGNAAEIACNGKDDDCDEATPDFVDADADTVCDTVDACPGFDDKADGDNDGTPDGCDLCPADPNDDSDGDGSCDSLDLCAGYDDNTDTDTDGTPDGCDFCVGSDPSELFAEDMAGCPGTVNWLDRATLCTAGFTPCTGQQWVDRHQGAAPTYNYWTDDELQYGGSQEACTVAVEGLFACYDNEPMRVCAGVTDALGNECNWTGCTWNGSGPGAYFGGCEGNSTAGTLCCR